MADLNISQSNVSARIELIELDGADTRTLAGRHRVTALLRDRQEEIQTAIGETVAVIQDAATSSRDRTGWRVSTLEATFGIALTAEAGAIVSRAGAEASLQVTVTLERA